METWVITGGAGFVGTSFINYILSNKDKIGFAPKIFIYDNFSAFSLELYTALTTKFKLVEVQNTSAILDESEVGIITGDINDADTLKKSVLSSDRILHLAANTGVQLSLSNPLKDCETNIIGTLNCLELARELGSKRFIHASSAAPLGSSKDYPYNETSLPCPSSPYGASKLSGEAYVGVYQQTFSLSAVSLRFSNLFGEGCYHKTSVVSKMVKDAFFEGEITIFGDGKQTRDMLPIPLLNEMIFAILMMPQDKLNTSLFQLGTGVETEILSLAKQIKDIIETDYNTAVNIRFRDPLLGDVRRNYSDISAFEKAVFVPDLNDYSSVLRETIGHIFNLKQRG